jgi:hypothetical protein
MAYIKASTLITKELSAETNQVRRDRLFELLVRAQQSEAEMVWAHAETAKNKSAAARAMKKKAAKLASSTGPKTVTGAAVSAGLERQKRDRGEI